MASDAGQPEGAGAGGEQLTRLHRKATIALAEAILPEESPEVILRGLGGSAIIGTDRTAYVFKIGLKAGVPFGYRLKPFEYESIMRVDVRSGRGVDVVVIHAPLKISVCPSYWADERDDPWKARNAIPVAVADQEVEEGVARLVKLVEEFWQRHGRPSKPIAPVPEHPGPLPNVVEHLDELEQQRSLQPVMTPGPGREECPRCGNALRARWQFCPRCGAPVEDTRDPGQRRRFFTPP